MEKLELKHLVGYLPYGLKGVNRNGTIFLLHTNASSGGKIEKREISTFLSEEFKPILRPLSDLTKEIEVNGEKFVPIVELCKLSFGYLDLTKMQLQIDEANGAFSVSLNSILLFSFDSNDNSFIAMHKGKTVCVPNQLELFEKLLEWHFDIYGLIEKGLAIDINTLNK